MGKPQQRRLAATRRQIGTRVTSRSSISVCSAQPVVTHKPLTYNSALLIEEGAITLARPAGVEPTTYRFVGGCSVLLSYGRVPI